MDAEDIQALGRGFWYRWAAGMSVGVAGVLAATLVVGEIGWLAATYGLMALLFAGFAAVTFAVGERADAAGNVVSGAGFAVVGVAIVQGFPSTLYWGGWMLALAGVAVGRLADFRARGGDAADG